MRKEKSVKRLSLLRMLLVVFLLMNSLWVVAQVKVVDAESGTPVCYASVFDDATGKALGITTSEGLLPSAAESCKTVSVQHINYEPVTVAMGSVQGNIIKLTVREAYQVPEVAVAKAKHDYLRLKFYVREYTIMNGMVAETAESVGYGYFHSKSKKYDKGICMTMRRMHNDAAFKGQKESMRSFAECHAPYYGEKIKKKIKFYNKYNDGKRHTEYYQGHKKLATYFVRHDKNAKRVDVVIDSMLVEKPFKSKLLGLSFSDVYSSSSFNSAYGKPSLSTWLNSVYTCRITHIKSKTSVNIYCETYVLGVDFADKEDYKTLKKELEQKAKSGTSTKFVRPEGFPGFNKYVTNAMKNMKVISD